MNFRRKFVWTAIPLALVMSVTGTNTVLRAQTPGLSLADAQKAIEAAEKAAGEKKLLMSFAVVDARGDLIAMERMPGAGVNTPDTAIGKAMVAAIYGQPSAASVTRATSPTSQGFNEATGGRLRFLQGAVPIIRNNVIVGAIGASGAQSQQDEDAAKAGLAVIP